MSMDVVIGTSIELGDLTGVSLSDETIVFCHSRLYSEGKSTDKFSQTKNSPGATWRQYT
jgi:hypothetical protein